jgi:predicted transcriptional regulator
METPDLKQLDKNNREIATILISLGMKKKTAKMLVYLQNVYEASVVEIERGSGLNQTDIGDVIRELRQHDWISEREEGIPDKGRPPRIFSLKIGFNEIIALLEDQQKRKADGVRSKIERLKTLRKMKTQLRR